MFRQALRTFLGPKSVRTVSPEAVTWAYRLLLGREPSPAEVHRHADCADLDHLRRTLFGSREFRTRWRHLCGPSLTGFEPPLEIEDEVDQETLERLLLAVQNTWALLGRTEPHWSVISVENFKQSTFEQNREVFYQSGQENVELFLHLANRNGCFRDGVSEKNILEYGCGVGRITHALAQRFKQVYAYDISAPHLELARQFTSSLGLHNIHFRQISHPLDVGSFPSVDAFYTLIVLQHNPPPIIRLILSNLLKSLVPGGLAFFQLQTFQTGYTFSARDYLRSVEGRREPQIEMHVLPQSRVFDMIYEHNCKVLEVLDDPFTGYAAGDLSNTFLIQKR